MGQLGVICRTSGTGPFPGDGYPPKQDQGPLRIRCASPNWFLWSRARGSKRHSIRPAFIHWHVDRNGHGKQPHKSPRTGQVCATTKPDARWNEQGGPSDREKLPVESDVPEWMAMAGKAPEATELIKSVADNAFIAFCFPLRIGEYSTRPGQSADKLTDQFKVKDVTFFKRVWGRLKQLYAAAPSSGKKYYLN